MKNTLHSVREKCLTPVYLALLLAFSLFPTTHLRAKTQYWNKTNTNLTWANSGNANWTDSDNGTSYTAWTSDSDAVIVTSSASISFGGSYVTAASLTVRDGAMFTHINTGNTGVRITGANGSSGSGNFSLSENAESTASLRVYLQAHVAESVGYNGTITVNNFSNTSSGLYLGADGKTTDAYTGTNTNTRIILNGGTLFLNGGLANNTATIGSLAGSGHIALGNIFSGNSGTRTLRVEQTKGTDTIFTGTIGSRTISQTNNLLALTKSGEGSLTINVSGNEDSGYAGDTTVEQGTLRLIGTFGNSAVSGTVNQGNFIVKSGATLGLDGTFNIGGSKTLSIEDGGSLDAGRMTLDGAGTTTSAGIAFGDNANIHFALGSGDTGSLITLVDASMKGSASGGASSIFFHFTDAGDATIGTTYDLIHFGTDASTSIVSTTYALSQESIDAGWLGTFNYSGDGKTLQFTIAAIPPIPEPATTALLVAIITIGVTIIIVARRHRIRA